MEVKFKIGDTVYVPMVVKKIEITEESVVDYYMGLEKTNRRNIKIRETSKLIKVG